MGGSPQQNISMHPKAHTVSVTRRYKACDTTTKQQHNAWVLSAAQDHQPSSAILVLDGADLNTTNTLIDGGIHPQSIHVPNKHDYDAIVSRHQVCSHGNLYRSTVQTWVETLAMLTEPPEPIKTVWLDYTG